MNINPIGLLANAGALEGGLSGALSAVTPMASSFGGALTGGLGSEELNPEIGEAMNNINALSQLATTLGNMSTQMTQQATSGVASSSQPVTVPTQNDPQQAFHSFSQMTQQQGGASASSSLADLIDGGNAADA